MTGYVLFVFTISATKCNILSSYIDIIEYWIIIIFEFVARFENQQHAKRIFLVNFKVIGISKRSKAITSIFTQGRKSDI